MWQRSCDVKTSQASVICTHHVRLHFIVQASGGVGGGVFCNQAGLHVQNGTFRQNRAAQGSAVAVVDAPQRMLWSSRTVADEFSVEVRLVPCMAVCVIQ